MTYIEKEPLLETVKAMQDDSAFGVPRIIAAIENAPASEVAREIEEWYESYFEKKYMYRDPDPSKDPYGKAKTHDLMELCLAELKKKYTEDGK